MKRDQNLQRMVLAKIENADEPTLRFEEFAKNFGGYDDATTPDWTDDEAYNIRLLIRDGMLLTSRVNDAPWFGNAPDDAYAETYISLTTSGHDWLEKPNWLRRALKNIWENISTLIAAVATALVIQWSISLAGPPSNEIIENGQTEP